MCSKEGMEVGHNKAEYICVTEREAHCGTVRLQGLDLEKVHDFKYLG